MKNNDKYIIAIMALSVLLVTTILIIILGVAIINDLNDTIDMHINSRNTCQIDLNEAKAEYEELEKVCDK